MKDVHYPMTDAEYEDLRMGLENCPQIETAFHAVIETLDNHLLPMDKHQRLFIATHLATTIIAGALTDCCKDYRYLINASIEKLAEQATHKTQMMLNAIDKGEL